MVILEAGEIGKGTTGASTGNLYAPVGPRLYGLEKKHGMKVVEAVVSIRTKAINFIAARIDELQIACDFRRVPFFLFSAPDDAAAREVQHECATARSTLLPVSDGVPVTFPFRAAALMTVADQAQFNPLQYTLGLADALVARGCIIHENCRALETIDGEPCKVVTADGSVTAPEVVKATHVPQGLYAIHAAMIPQREYAVLARVKGEVPMPGIYWNANPAWRYSVRPWQSAEGNFIMALGEPHKPGEPQAGQLARMEQFLREHFAVNEITHTWAAQNYQPADLLPYIGTSPTEKHTWLATGFAADGLVWGTVAGEIISRGIQQREHECADMFDPKRFTPLASSVNAVKETAAVARHLLHDVFVYGRARECEALAPGEGCVVRKDGEKIAICRDSAGDLHAVSAVCTHMGCLVHWNALEQSWDCPCHGSRFSIDGRVLEGPAQHDLAIPR